MTAPVAASATSLSVPDHVAFTSKASAAGNEFASSGPAKFRLSVSPFTLARRISGGVLLVAVSPLNAGASLPDRSLSRFEASLGRTYATSTSRSYAAGVAKVAVAVRPEMDTPVESTFVVPMVRWNTSAASGTLSSRGSSKVTVTVSQLAAAETNAGPVLSPVRPTRRLAKLSSSVLVVSCSTAPLAGLS